MPRWSKENHCFSCHNNGDAARALYAAKQRRYPVPTDALADTTRWLLAPGTWDNNRGNPAFSDKKLARIQFAAALAEACDTGAVHNRVPLIEAAESLLRYQEPDGSWQVDSGAAIGSPATYGTTLATYMVRRTLEKAGSGRFKSAIERANGWLSRTNPHSVMDAAVLLLAFPGNDARLNFIVGAQASDGGWGPQPLMPAEPFDTALALLALSGVTDSKRTGPAIRRGRAYLIKVQQPSGGWPETTRPAGAQSYAQHISTSGWATLALLETNPER